ncbi:MAG: 1-(5-phosphoribosyl)-5-[(5-phosphoribosylamino)methylideneamino]imidazole-4-carboxamide isomerase [Alphaproteobacteria bacterium]|nr:1-(5-phosphoribosyl)-5-[(5-phosphoribosylamino)methylideneamino]imidazole-4-carboxamide isomerase [Alphaproteobacteria bacterium]
MIVYPAIDLKDGRCVRLVRGEMKSATVFNDDPAAQARDFAAAGAQWIHVVDLDGAFAGKPKNAAAVETIVAAVPALKIQLGGGIRDERVINNWLEKGVARVVLGTAAVKNPNLVRAACRRWPGRVALGIDARDGLVRIEGWGRAAAVAALDLARRFEDAGAAAIVFTDIDRDGALEGVNVEATAALARALKTPVIASGGISSLDDLAALRAHEKDGVAGAIIGRALYDGRIDLKSALALMAA